MTVLMWFRSDLRVADNTALQTASRSGDVRALFIVTPGQWVAHDMAPVQQRFIALNVAQLHAALTRFGIALDVITVDGFADVPQAMAHYCQRHAITAVFCNREYPVNEKQRDASVGRLLQAQGVALQQFDDQCIVAPGALKSLAGKPYVVFTPFAKAWRAHCASWPPGHSPLPARNRKPQKTAPPLTGDGPGATPVIGWKPGEQAAQAALDAFMQQRVGSYDSQRDFPALDATSRLSPYLALGVLSARQCLAAAQRAQKQATALQKRAIACWIDELIWRDFYLHIADAFAGVSKHQPFRAQTASIPWRDDEADFAAWCEGRTGVPIVDAAMRQLVQTGWMHNRLRMITAMFLAKNLLIDWRRGERFFMRHLIDGFLASNNGGWQWCASTGTDAAPYFRVFNPQTQGQRFDPDGDFIRRFVPELAQLDKRHIHMPPRDLLGELGYPPPIVDLAASRRRAIEVFANVGMAGSARSH